MGLLEVDLFVIVCDLVSSWKVGFCSVLLFVTVAGVSAMSGYVVLVTLTGLLRLLSTCWSHELSLFLGV